MGNGELLFAVDLCQTSSSDTLLKSLKESLNNNQYSIPACSSPGTSSPSAVSSQTSVVTAVAAEAYEGGNICINVTKKINGTGRASFNSTTIHTKMCANKSGEVSLFWSTALTIQRIIQGKTGHLAIGNQPISVPNTMGLGFSPDSVKKAFQAIIAQKPKPAGSF